MCSTTWSLAVEPGEFVHLGPSGSGETTLLRLIAGFGAPASGRIVIGNRDVTPLPPWGRNISMVFQSYALWPHMSVARTPRSAWSGASSRMRKSVRKSTPCSLS